MSVVDFSRADDERVLRALDLFYIGKNVSEVARELGYISRNEVMGVISRVRNEDIAASCPLEDEKTVRAGYRK